MPFAPRPDRSLRELLSATAVDPSLRLRLKARTQAILADWGIRTPGQTVYFVEPGETPAAGRHGEVFVELPEAALALDEDALDVVAGGWDQARDRAVAAVDRAVNTVSWQGDPWQARL